MYLELVYVCQNVDVGSCGLKVKNLLGQTVYVVVWRRAVKRRCARMGVEWPRVCVCWKGEDSERD